MGKKLIEVALPLEAINIASAREKSIRHGHPSTLHLWWARRPLAAARAVVFAQMVDDPSAHPDIFKTEKAQEKERQRLFKIIEELVKWENTTNEEVLQKARDEIWQSWRSTCAENADHPRATELFDRHKLPAFHDPFAGGGALPLEAQRLGLESYAVIHSLWEKGDRNPLILPANIPIDDPRVQFELTRYLSDNWVPIIEKDVDGPNSLPLRMDGDVPNLGKFAACRRVARTIYLGSAPTATAANRGIEDRRVKLGCVMPGESPAVFGDALRRLAAAATYLYQDGPRYWYSTQPTVTKLAEDRAEQLKRDPDKVVQELEGRLRNDLRHLGDFPRVQPMPGSSADVPDEREARLVVLSVDHPYVKEAGCPAEVAARAILTSRGNTPRLYQNTLVFLAADKTRLQDLDEAARRVLAWESILDEQSTLDLTPHQVKQAETQKKAADDAVTARIPETYQWLLVPTQTSPKAPVELSASRLTSGGALAVRASQKLKKDEMLVTDYAGTMLRKSMDAVPLWRGDHVPIKQLVEDFAKYLYLPRLRDGEVLIDAVRDGLARLTWNGETYAFADSWDEKKAMYVGLRGGETTRVTLDSAGLLVKPDVAARQIEAQRRPDETPTEPGEADPTRRPGDGPMPPADVPLRLLMRRFHGAVSLDPERLGRDAGRIAEEIIQHLTTLPDASVQVTLEIEARIPDGAPDNVVRTVTENARTLKFQNQGFEEE